MHLYSWNIKTTYYQSLKLQAEQEMNFFANQLSSTFFTYACISLINEMCTWLLSIMQRIFFLYQNVLNFQLKVQNFFLSWVQSFFGNCLCAELCFRLFCVQRFFPNLIPWSQSLSPDPPLSSPCQRLIPSAPFASFQLLLSAASPNQHVLWSSPMMHCTHIMQATKHMFFTSVEKNFTFQYDYPKNIARDHLKDKKGYTDSRSDGIVQQTGKKRRSWEWERVEQESACYISVSNGKTQSCCWLTLKETIANNQKSL